MSHENEVEQLNIAICDDEENIRIYIRKLIQKQETFCKITEFSSGKELLEFQDETNAEEIDILFLDISMGDEDGMTVAKQLRSHWIGFGPHQVGSGPPITRSRERKCRNLGIGPVLTRVQALSGAPPLPARPKV